MGRGGNLPVKLPPSPQQLEGLNLRPLALYSLNNCQLVMSTEHIIPPKIMVYTHKPIYSLALKEPGQQEVPMEITSILLPEKQPEPCSPKELSSIYEKLCLLIICRADVLDLNSCFSFFLQVLLLVGDVFKASFKTVLFPHHLLWN